MKATTKEIYNELLVRYPTLNGCAEEIERAVEMLIACFRDGKKLLVCGNGGSAADSEHVVGELMKGFKLPRRLSTDMQEKLYRVCPDEVEAMLASLQGALPAISLVSQTALMTAFSNDQSAQYVFAQQVLGYGKAGDVLLAISTSGNSVNVLHAARVAAAQGVKVLSLTGASGGALKALSDVCVCAPSDITYQIQEYHLPIYHCLCACVENEVFGEEA